MGRYITYSADLYPRYRKLADVNSLSNIDSNYVTYAEAEVDGLLSPGFSVPFSSNNLTVKGLCIDTTLYKIWEYKDTTKAEVLRESIDRRIEALLDGAQHMVTSSGDVIQMSGQDAWSETQDYTPVFGKGAIEDFQVDSTQLYNEEVDRD